MFHHLSVRHAAPQLCLFCVRQHRLSLQLDLDSFELFALSRLCLLYLVAGPRLHLDGAELCMEQNRNFGCDEDMKGSYFAASAARAVCSYFRNEDTLILCVPPYIRWHPLNSLSAAHVSSRLH